MTEDALDQAILRAQAGDPAGFDLLVDWYAARVFGLVYRLAGSRADAEDLLQEVMLRVVRRIADYRHRGRFEAWLFRIAANVARDHARRAGVRRTVCAVDSEGRADPLDEVPDSRQEAPEFRLRLSEEVDELQKALARLPSAEREVVMLRHFSDMSFKEISEAMSAPLGTTLARAHRGLRKLRQLLDPEGWMQNATG